MPRKPSKYVERAELTRVEGERSLLLTGLHCLVHQAPEHTTYLVHDGLAYTFQLYRANGAAGGFVLTTTRSTDPHVNGNSATFTLFDDWVQTWRGYLVWAPAVTELTEARYRLWNQDKARGE